MPYPARLYLTNERNLPMALRPNQTGYGGRAARQEAEDDRRQMEDDAREAAEGVICGSCAADTADGGRCSEGCSMPSTCACPGKRSRHWWTCRYCGEEPVRYPASPCSECTAAMRVNGVEP